MAISGDTAVISAPAADTPVAKGMGMVYIFKRRNGDWVNTYDLYTNDGTSIFGEAVAISGNTVAVGAYGKAYVFEFTSGSWKQQAVLTGDGDGSRTDFGDSVAISGDTVVVGSPFDSTAAHDAGAAYVFQRFGDAWVRLQRIVASDAAAGDLFGRPVAISGNTMIFGVPTKNGVLRGGLRLGVRAPLTGLGSGKWVETQRLESANPTAGDYFGGSVAISGDTAVVGAPFENNQLTGGGVCVRASGWRLGPAGQAHRRGKK